MKDEYLCNIYRYGLYEDQDFMEGSQETSSFGDDIGSESLDRAKDPSLAAEATVVMKVFILISHRLSIAVEEGKAQRSPDLLIDSSVALWIGREQAEGQFENGWMMYSIAQSALRFFGHEGKESQVNTDMMNLFNDMQRIGRSCGSSARDICRVAY